MVSSKEFEKLKLNSEKNKLDLYDKKNVETLNRLRLKYIKKNLELLEVYDKKKEELDKVVEKTNLLNMEISLIERKINYKLISKK